jgi:hypothetical protein
MHNLEKRFFYQTWKGSSPYIREDPFVVSCERYFLYQEKPKSSDSD